VWVTYTGVHPGVWESLDLTQDHADSTLWTGTLSVTNPNALRWIVQAVNGVGLVSLDDDLGNLYSLGNIPPALQSASVPRSATQLALTAPGDGPYGSSATVSATLTAGGSPVANEQVTFSLGGATATGTTNASGVATAHLGLVAAPGATTLTAGFDGDATYVASSASQAFTIDKLPSSLSLTGGGNVVPGGDTGVSATLTNAGIALASRAVTFTLTPSTGSPVVQSRTTDLFGHANLGPVPSLAPGTYTVQASFAADAVYQASQSGTVQITVLPATVGGLQTLLQSFGLQKGDLGDTLANAAKQFGSGKQSQGCQQLDNFARKIFDMLSDGKTPTTAQAGLLVSLGLSAEQGYGCLPASSTLPAAEQDVVDLIATIAAVTPQTSQLSDLRESAATIGKNAIGPSGGQTCTRITSLQATVKTLAAGPRATIGAALTLVRLDFKC
jgi:hypothetical protein